MTSNEKSEDQLFNLTNINKRLTIQLKRLFKTEYELHKTQEQLDTQIHNYKQLYEIGKKFNTTFDLDIVFQLVIEFVIYELNFERCLVLIFNSDKKYFNVQALDGYYDENIYQKMLNLKLKEDDSIPLLFRQKLQQIICTMDKKNKSLLTLGNIFKMDEFIIFPLNRDPKNKYGLLIAGNTKNNLQYYTRIQSDSDSVISLANLVSLVNITINNIDYYKELENARQKEKFAILGMLVGSISHEIFNPLSGISGPLDNLKKIISEKNSLGSNQKINKYFNYIDENVKKIKRIINNLRVLYFDKELKIESLKIEKIIELILTDFKNKHKDRIQFNYYVEKNIEIKGDKQAFYQILNNLIHNAVDSLDLKGEINIKVYKSGPDKLIQIIDNGKGIGGSNLDKIFNAFYTTKNVKKGIGLGLFIVKSLIVKLNWDIKVESIAGKGTIFTIIIKD